MYSMTADELPRVLHMRRASLLLHVNVSCVLQQALRFVKALVCLVVHFFFVQYLPVEIVLSPWYNSQGMLKK